MSEIQKANTEKTPESYRPNGKPKIINIAERYSENMKIINETFVKQINEHTVIIDRDEFSVVGVKVHFSAESRGNLTDFGTNTVRAVGQKYIQNGTIDIISDLLRIENPEIIGIRTNITGDGIFDFVIGVISDSVENLPEYLPENTVTVSCPAKRYVKMNINEKKAPERTGYDEQMQADEYFIGQFRNETPYVYDKSGIPFNTYDKNGEFFHKYEPIKIPESDAEKYDSFMFKVVSLPEILCACSTQGPGDNDFVIFKYFGVQDQVFPLECARMYNDDYYGFPCDINGITYSCFGSRVSSFDGLPDCVAKLTVPSGIYLHISQLEFNGDNPSMPYDIAFNHIDELFLKDHPQYERDHGKHVIARFRQANCASVFVPLNLK